MGKISGTKEWSVASVNCLVGCSHDCRYCYARANALRFRRIKSPDDWAKPRVRQREVKKRRRRVRGRVMFPTTHDILPEFLEPCLTVLRRLLNGGNEVLVVTKPHFECVRAICGLAGFDSGLLNDARERIVFRFTIGAVTEELLAYWEPGAPTYAERHACLQYAFEAGFETSVSCEPLLDAHRVEELVEEIDPWVTDTIWIGAMNQVDQRCVPGTDPAAIAAIKAGQTPGRMQAVYEALRGNRKIRWKESYKKVLGLGLATAPGLDV